ncbi:hypothetical protein NDK47_10695 [Brevibacillus ruminantium]|uniref:Uncharacterized protein n=1 Tax=Brevibacillus ruminantium TaxID=2950604 RepID=A0ABY4WM12_9BACL|nr:hypothetical protein [Brevibacillus ruminantium]USG67709.1 hypothetical protein NDK47_10695 [Brevibacillus ruminantium]
MKPLNTEDPLQVKQLIIREFYDLIGELPDHDHPATVQKLVRYLQGLLRIKKVVPPVVEIMTLIKQSKPTLYTASRRTISTTSNLYMVFQIDMNPALAEERMRDFMKA